MGAFCNHNLLD